MQTKHWIAFIALAAIWSSSFLWIEIALRETGPFLLVAFRVTFGLIFAGVAAFSQRDQWPRDLRTWGIFSILGITSLAAPFFLITWAQTLIDSAVASIINATVPLFTILFAHYFLHDDRMTRQRALGMLVGFAGAVTLFSENLHPSARNPFIGQAAVLLAAIFYAASSVYARKATAHVTGIIRGAGPFPAAVAAMWMVTPVLESPITIPTQPLTWIALLWLGALGSGLALILWYYLLHEIGPTRTTLVTYVFPLGGVALGVLFLGEPLSWQLVVGAILIISSIAVVNWSPKTA